MSKQITKLPGSMVEIKNTIPWEKVLEQKAKVLEMLGNTMEIEGFRKGHIPPTIVEKNIQPTILVEYMAEFALEKILPDIIKDAKIDAIGRPEVIFTTLAEGNNVDFTVKIAVLPEFSLPDYKDISKENNKKIDAEMSSFETTDEELHAAIKELQTMRAHQKLHEKGGHGEHDHSHGEITDDMLPEANDEFAKTFGFETLDALREKVRENMKKEKEAKHSEKKRISLLDSLVEKTEIDLPIVLVDTEIDSMISRVKYDVEMMQLSFDDYLKHINKTESDMREDFKKDAEKRVKMKLILANIAKKEKIIPDEERVEKELHTMLQAYPDADKTRARAYIEEMLQNEAVFELLEKK